MTGFKHSVIALVAAAGLLACSGNGPAGTYIAGGAGQGLQSHGGPVRDHVSLVDTLRAQGVQVDILGDIQQPFLSPTGIRLGLRGGPLGSPVEVQSYPYDDASQARAEADTIGPDGNPRTRMVTWVDDPHFFLKERVMVLYVGHDPQALALLGRLLGPQFAGR